MVLLKRCLQISTYANQRQTKFYKIRVRMLPAGASVVPTISSANRSAIYGDLIFLPKFDRKLERHWHVGPIVYKHLDTYK